MANSPMRSASSSMAPWLELGAEPSFRCRSLTKTSMAVLSLGKGRARSDQASMPYAAATSFNKAFPGNGSHRWQQFEFASCDFGCHDGAIVRYRLPGGKL